MAQAAAAAATQQAEPDEITIIRGLSLNKQPIKSCKLKHYECRFTNTINEHIINLTPESGQVAVPHSFQVMCSSSD